MRSLKELLQILLDNIDKYKDTVYPKSLCFIVIELLYDNVITDEESNELNDYLLENACKSKYTKTNDITHLFKPGNWTSRKKWLEKQINKL